MNYEVVAPVNNDINNLLSQRVLLPFDPIVLDFIEALSKEILGNRSFKKFPELVAMAFWMRRANILRLKKHFEDKKGKKLWIGRGIIFHIAPSNVDSIFIYSWFLSMLAGDINIVRISNKGTLQIDLLLSVINELSKKLEFIEVVDRFMIIRYEHDEEITGYLSSLCNMRVIWGGDATIRTIRKIPINSNALELTFTDKFSISVIKADEFWGYAQQQRIIDNFYNDAFWFGQLACSSPRLVVWIGKDADIEISRDIFWHMVEKKVLQEKPNFATATAVDKLVTEYSIAIHNPHIKIEKSNTSLINRILLENHEDIRRELHCGGGLFYEIKLDNLEQLACIITEKEQTISIFGFHEDELTDFVKNNRPKGIDRFVSIGKALIFSATWDGHDLLREFCREIEIDI